MSLKTNLCACGCGETTNKNCKYVKHHHLRGKKPWNYNSNPAIPKYCKCGCGKLVNRFQYHEFIHGHNRKGITRFTKQLCKCGCGQLTNIGRTYINHHNVKDSHKNGYIKQNTESKTKISNTLKEFYNNPINRQKRIDITTNLWKTSKYILKQTNGRGYYKNKSINKSEQALFNILNQISPNRFNYNGNCSANVIINGHVPDFVDKDNTVIEMFGCFYHKCIKCYHNIDNTNTIRTRNLKIVNDYADSNTKFLIIWEHELKNKEKVSKKINEFLGCVNVN